MLLGIEDPYVWLAYLLCILSTILCVAYGLINWNRGEDAPSAPDLPSSQQEFRVEEEL